MPYLWTHRTSRRRWRRPRKALARSELEAYRFALAERLGMTVARLEREMGTRELAQWIAYDRHRAGRQEQAVAKARMVGRARGARGRLGDAGS